MSPSPPAISGPCEILDWDSRFFGVRVARVLQPTLCDDSAARIDEWCRDHKVDLLYFLAACDDARTTWVAGTRGYHLTDLRTTLECDAASGPAAPDGIPSLRAATAEDLPALEAIARDSHHDSRFYFDLRLSRERCDELFATWIRRSMNGYADVVLVRGEVGKPEGYVSCKVDHPSLEGAIGLMAVGRDSRGKRLGKMLVEGATAWMQQQGVRRVRVVTQGRNIAGQRVYERCGFVIASLQLYYHKWFTPSV